MSVLKNRKRLRFIIDTFCICAVSAGVLIIWIFALPTYGNGLFQVEGGVPEYFEMPLSFESEENKTAVVYFTMNMRLLHATKYRFFADDCLEYLKINGTVVIDEAEPNCSYLNGPILDFSKGLHSGKNEIVARILNYGGPAGMRIEAYPGDTLFFLLLSFLIFSIFLYVIRAGKYLCFSKILVLIFIIGLMIRIFYTAGTPFDVRAHDVQGHIDYVHFLVSEKQIPHMGDGWEWYQPPLYYALLAPFSAIAEHMHLVENIEFFCMQIFSLILSLLSLVLIFYIGKELFPNKTQEKQKIIFIAFLSVFPSLVYFSSRINNDVLYAFFGFCTIYLIIKWWNTGKNMWWYVGICCISFGILSKSNALLLIPFYFALLFLNKNKPWKEKAIIGVKSFGIILLLTEWLFAFRWLSGDTMSMVGNINNLNSGLLLENTFANFLVFNPIRILELPFANPWDDAFRRQYFLEFFYKSAFFGEFTPRPSLHAIAVSLLLLNLLMLPLFFWGLWKRIKQNLYNSLPMILLFLIFIFGHMAFRFRFPYSSSQDFRYSILLLIPIVYFLIRGWEKSSRSVQRAYFPIFVSFMSVSTIFIFLLIYS